MIFAIGHLTGERIKLKHISLDQCKAEQWAVRYQLKSCTVPIFVPFRLSSIPALLYRPDACNCTKPYIPHTVPAYAVRDPAQTAEVVAQWGVEIVLLIDSCSKCHTLFPTSSPDFQQRNMFNLNFFLRHELYPEENCWIVL